MFPSMAGDEFDRFVADIKQHGQHVPVVVHEGKVLEGRNRVLACAQLGIRCSFEQYAATTRLPSSSA